MGRRGRKKKYTPDVCACMFPGSDATFGMIYTSMVQHENFIKLSNTAKVVYMCCRVQHASKAGRSVIYKHAEEEGITYPEGCFVFPGKHQKLYGFDKGNFSRCMKELIKAGFIEKYEDNRYRWQVTVYRFSQKWKGFNDSS